VGNFYTNVSVRGATGGLAFAVLNHDDDVLWFQLYRGSDLVAEFATRDGPVTRVRELCRALGRPAVAPLVWLILRAPLVFEVFRHQLLARRLGLPLASVGAGFTYIARGELPRGVARDRLVRLP
jgi:hypothetical protein